MCSGTALYYIGWLYTQRCFTCFSVKIQSIVCLHKMCRWCYTFIWAVLAGQRFWWIVSAGLLDRVTRGWTQNSLCKWRSCYPPIDWARMLHTHTHKNKKIHTKQVEFTKQESRSELGATQHRNEPTLTCPLRVQEPLVQSGTPLGCLSMGARPGGGDGVLCV